MLVAFTVIRVIPLVIEGWVCGNYASFHPFGSSVFTTENRIINVVNYLSNIRI